MSKHTPKPWVARMRDRQEWHIDAPNGDPSLNYGNWSSMVVYGCDENPEIGAEVAEANARLIAAAPELLEALELLADLLPDPELDTDDVQRELVTKARAAIAKATGAPAC